MGEAWERIVFYSDGCYLVQCATDFSRLLPICLYLLIVFILFALLHAGPDCAEVTTWAVTPHRCLISPLSRPSSL